MPLRPARVGRVGVIGAPVAKTAVVAAAVTPGTRRAGRQDCGRGRGRHTWAPSPHLARPQRRMLSEVLGLTKGGRFVLPVLRPHGRPLPVGGKV